MKKWLRTNVKNYYYPEKTLIMGILNVTPDSFSDGGKYTNMQPAVDQALKMEAEGADIIDIGGESTRPGYTPVTEAQEIERVVPVIKAVKEQIKIPISIDTMKANVAQAAVEAGASIINDVWGAKKDPEMAAVAAKSGVPIILMHNRRDIPYKSLMDDILSDLQESIDKVLAAGVKPEQIIIDPGIGFAKTYEENLQVMQQMERFRELDYPVLLGVSRKSVIAKTVNLPADQRDEASGAAAAFGITKGCEIIRVHNVKLHARMAQMMDKLMNKGSDING
ncbi:dihydropteroate synthase [Gracilibacillus alcaliphilus]|uniref:dihydropteroate synthase n=1 Tax=Gracilibacillus alcaliphilus TaxID=1401441 RepID=UPI00195785CF|nr:dihydropteroate synthase [Gracilibacillus alcaliphilus]MBM7678155.1 dihydropteroate synthase [Gracilibacillus alcaliphilus]